MSGQNLSTGSCREAKIPPLTATESSKEHILATARPSLSQVFAHLGGTRDSRDGLLRGLDLIPDDTKRVE